MADLQELPSHLLASDKRHCTDPLFLVLFLGGAVAPQIVLLVYKIETWITYTPSATNEVDCSKILKLLGCAIGLCVSLGLVLLQLLRSMPIRILVYGTLFGSSALLVVLGLWLMTNNESFHRDQLGWLFILCSALELLVASSFWKEIRLSIAILRATTNFLSDVPSVALLYPLAFGVLHFLVFLLWGMAGLGALALLRADVDGGLSQLMRESIGYFRTIFLVALYYFWGNCFLTALSSYATAAATAKWYFAPQPAKRGIVGPAASLKLVREGFWRHGGSLALGSLLVALLNTLTLLLFWAGKGHKRKEGDPSWRKLVYRIRESAAGFLECFARFVSRQAYVEIALSGCTFFSGAAATSRRVANAPKRVAAVEGAGFAYRCASEVLLISMVGCATALYISCEGFRHLDEASPRENETLRNSDGTVRGVFVTCLGAWLVAETILHPVSVATSTILHCLLLDGGADKSHTPRALQQDLSFVGHYS